MKSALATVVLLAACSGDAAPPPGPRPAPTPRPELTAMFDALARDAIQTALKAKEMDRAASDPRDHLPPVFLIDEARADLTVHGARTFDIDLAHAGPRVVELRYQRGMRDYPSDLVDPQAEAARRAIDDCLAEDDDLARAIDRLGMLTMTVRIDHGRAPADVRLVGGHGLDGCVTRRMVILPADGVFLGVVRVYRQ